MYSNTFCAHECINLPSQAISQVSVTGFVCATKLISRCQPTVSTTTHRKLFFYWFHSGENIALNPLVHIIIPSLPFICLFLNTDNPTNLSSLTLKLAHDADDGMLLAAREITRIIMVAIVISIMALSEWK